MRLKANLAYLFIFLLLDMMLNTYYFSIVFMMQYFRYDIVTRHISLHNEASKRTNVRGVKYYGYIAVFAELILLPIHLTFGILIRKGNIKAKEKYVKFVNFVRIATLRKYFFVIA